MYSFLRTNGFSAEDVVAISRSQKKGHLVGANELDPANASHRVTLHHNHYLNMQDRLPRLRAGNAHAYDVLVDNAEAYAAKGRRDAVVAGMSASSAAKLSGSSATYSFDVTLNGAISTEGGAVLLEKSQLVGVVYRGTARTRASCPTGRCWPWTLYEIGALVFHGDGTSRSPLAPCPRRSWPSPGTASPPCPTRTRRTIRRSFRRCSPARRARARASSRGPGRAGSAPRTDPPGSPQVRRPPIEGRGGRAPAGAERYQLRNVMVMLYPPSSPLCAFTLLTIIITTA